MERHTSQGIRGGGSARSNPDVADILNLPAPPAWYADALCAQVDQDGFFPERGQSTREAKQTCEMCPVRERCLEYAIEHKERFGVWGGKSERERRKLEKAVVQAAEEAAALTLLPGGADDPEPTPEAAAS